jgi:predicted GIY-YIG superfamily endonuclease
VGDDLLFVPSFHYVYLLRSESRPDRPYIGYTTDLRERLTRHNTGRVRATTKHRPWRIETVIAFRSRDKALDFERYLKSHSGRAFTKRHF